MTEEPVKDQTMKTKRALTRRQFLQLCGAGLIVGSSAYYEHNQLTSLEITSYTIPFSKPLPHPVKIIHLSDIHNSYYFDHVHRSSHLVELVTPQKPDVICITGDLVDKRDPHPDEALVLLKLLSNLCPVLYVSGNHEKQLIKSHSQLMSDFYDKITEIPQVTTLSYDSEPFSLGSSIKIFGIQDPLHARKNAWINKLGQLASGCNLSNINILLSHRPEFFKSYLPFDITLSGHTHGGQLRIPFLGALWAPNQGFFPRFAAGHFRQTYIFKPSIDSDDNQLYNLSEPSQQGVKQKVLPLSDVSQTSHMFVSRGIGCSVIPVRTENHPEIISIELVSD